MASRRAFTHMTDIEADLVAALKTIRTALAPKDGTPEDDAFIHLESFAAVAIRVMRQTNPSKIRSCAMIEEIKARIDGRAID